MLCKTKGNKLGLVLGLLFALCHLVWVVLVAVGAGQSILNWVSSLHFVNLVHTVTVFNFGTAVLGLVVAFVSGYVIGLVAKLLCQWICKGEEKTGVTQ